MFLGTFNSWVLPLNLEKRLEVVFMSKKDFLILDLIIIIFLLLVIQLVK